MLNHLCFFTGETVGVWAGRRFQAQVWTPLPSLKKDHVPPLSVWGQLWMGLKVLRHPIKAQLTPLAAFFYPSCQSSRGGLSFNATVWQNGEPSAFSCTYNVHCEESRVRGCRMGEGLMARGRFVLNSTCFLFHNRSNCRRVNTRQQTWQQKNNSKLQEGKDEVEQWGKVWSLLQSLCADKGCVD